MERDNGSVIEHLTDLRRMEMAGVGVQLFSLIKRCRAKGFVTYDEINEAMPPKVQSEDEVDAWLAALTEAGIEVREAAPGAPPPVQAQAEPPSDPTPRPSQPSLQSSADASRFAAPRRPAEAPPLREPMPLPSSPRDDEGDGAVYL